VLGLAPGTGAERMPWRPLAPCRACNLLTRLVHRCRGQAGPLTSSAKVQGREPTPPRAHQREGAADADVGRRHHVGQRLVAAVDLRADVGRGRGGDGGGGRGRQAPAAASEGGSDGGTGKDAGRLASEAGRGLGRGESEACCSVLQPGLAQRPSLSSPLPKASPPPSARLVGEHHLVLVGQQDVADALAIEHVAGLARVAGLHHHVVKHLRRGGGGEGGQGGQHRQGHAQQRAAKACARAARGARRAACIGTLPRAPRPRARPPTPPPLPPAFVT
jgi:hypothetical protein